MKDTKLDGLSFNTAHILTFKNEAEWLVYCEDNKHWYEGQPGRIDKLKAVYAMAEESKMISYGPVIKTTFAEVEAVAKNIESDKKKADLNIGTQDSPEEIE